MPKVSRVFDAPVARRDTDSWMMPINTPTIAAPSEFPRGELPPTACRSLTELGDWWRDTFAARVPHDFGVLGLAPYDHANIALTDIALVHGPVQAEKSLLLAYCSSLLAVWRVMRQAALLDLGPCTCVGEPRASQDTAPHRTFLVHAVDAGDGRMCFAILAASEWASPDTAKSAIAVVMPAIAHRLAHLPARRATPTRRAADAAPQPCRVTPREREIGQLVRAGLTNKEIARALQVSPHTVRNQVAHLSQKLGARNRAQLALLMPEVADAAVASAPPRHALAQKL